MKKAQAANEFVMFFGFFLLIFMIFLILVVVEVGGEVDREKKRQAYYIVADFAREINDAVMLGDGYMRYYEFPQTIAGNRYNVTIRRSGFVELCVIDESSTACSPKSFYVFAPLLIRDGFEADNFGDPAIDILTFDGGLSVDPKDDGWIVDTVIGDGGTQHDTLVIKNDNGKIKLGQKKVA
ncbi:MAG: hypothetical protein QXP42_00730 [Candidatus Micrarchaeia archaeon]